MAMQFLFTPETLRSLGDGVFLLDRDWNVRLVNPFVEEVLGLSEAQMAGRPIDQFLGDHDILDYLEEVKQTTEPVGGIELSLFTPDEEEEYTVRMGITPIFSTEGNLEGALILFHDITEMTRLRIQLHRQNQLFTVGALAGWVAHELRNPLTAINIHLELFLQEVENLPEPKQQLTSMAKMLQGEIVRLGTNLNEFLNFNRLPPLRKELCDLNEVVTSVVEFMDAEAQLSDVYLDSKLAPDLPKIRLDVNQFHLVLVNLIKNSIQAIKNAGDIDVITERTKNGARIRVVDTGSGIPAKSLPHIFDFLFTTKKDSSGLGLPIVRKIVTEHGGKIAVKSQVGKGTEFIIDLPLS